MINNMDDIILHDINTSLNEGDIVTLAAKKNGFLAYDAKFIGKKIAQNKTILVLFNGKKEYVRISRILAINNKPTINAIE